MNMNSTLRITLWWVLGFLATLIGFYPIIYFLVDPQFGLLASKSAALLADDLWNICFYGHITFGGISLAIGWLQFNEKLRNRYLILHRRIGITYVISVLISGICGIYIGFFATGGIVSSFGFIALGIIWLSTTFLGFKSAKNRAIAAHQNYMTYSYAACFAAVMLRLWLPILSILFGEFVIAYKIVAWLCWVPNMGVAYLMVNNNNKSSN